MEKRKIQKTGGASFSVILPKKWVELNNLKDKDELILSFEEKTRLCITRSLSDKKLRVKINILKISKRQLKRELYSAYVMGYDQIEIRGEIGDDIRLYIREIIKAFKIMDVSLETSKKIILENVVKFSSLSYDDNLKNIYTMTESIFTDTVEAVLKNDKKEAQNIVIRDLEINKIYLLFQRYTNSLLQGKLNEEEVGISHLLARVNLYNTSQLERVADHCVKIAQFLQETNPVSLITDKNKKTILNISKTQSTVIKEISKKKCEIKEPELHFLFKKIDRNEIDIDSLKKSILKNKSNILVVIDSLDRVNGYILNILEAYINYNYRLKA